MAGQACIIHCDSITTYGNFIKAETESENIWDTTRLQES